ncbi:exodeoxyribonuclease VII large subunit, partial [Micromonospora aurantiaca]|nr:exodeoxyribonuclease VII large subunit [Micromonospora aurantiaca]
LSHTRARLLALSPAATLERGYAIVQREDGSVVRESAAVKDGEHLHVRLSDGRLDVAVTGREGS